MIHVVVDDLAFHASDAIVRPATARLDATTPTVRRLTASSVRRAWQSALERAAAWSFVRLSTPPLGTGAGNLSLEDASEIMVQVVKAHGAAADYPAEVTVVVETPLEREVFEAALRRWVAADS